MGLGAHVLLTYRAQYLLVTMGPRAHFILRFSIVLGPLGALMIVIIVASIGPWGPFV